MTGDHRDYLSRRGGCSRAAVPQVPSCITDFSPLEVDSLGPSPVPLKTSGTRFFLGGLSPRRSLFAAPAIRP